MHLKKKKLVVFNVHHYLKTGEILKTNKNPQT